MCDIFSNSFYFYMQLLNSVQAGATHTVFEVAPNGIIAGFHIQ
jgi:hypothetical protein